MTTPRVRDWMTKEPAVIAPSTSIHEAHKLMISRRVRRLPVMRGDHLVGLVTLGDIRAVEPSSATSLSRAEILTLLDTLTIENIMTRKVITVTPETSIRDAAALMLQHKVSGLPVLDGSHIAGIITESDIFRMLVRNLDAVPA